MYYQVEQVLEQQEPEIEKILQRAWASDLAKRNRVCSH